MIQILTIALWAHLFCGKWSEPESIFGGLKEWLFNRLPWYIFKPLIGCAMCHAVWVSMAFEVYLMTTGRTFDFGSALKVTLASFAAILLDDFQTWRENLKNR
jgi:hypothetical protein